MDYDEYSGWAEFFRRRPEGWAEDSRTHKILQALGVKAPAEDLFYSLHTIKGDNQAQIDLRKMKQTPFYALLQDHWEKEKCQEEQPLQELKDLLENSTKT